VHYCHANPRSSQLRSKYRSHTPDAAHMSQLYPSHDNITKVAVEIVPIDPNRCTMAMPDPDRMVGRISGWDGTVDLISALTEPVRLRVPCDLLPGYETPMLHTFPAFCIVRQQMGTVYVARRIVKGLVFLLREHCRSMFRTIAS
jgi:hypothetical protein